MTLTHWTSCSVLAVAVGVAACSHAVGDRDAEQSTATDGSKQNEGSAGAEQRTGTGGSKQDVATGGAKQDAGTGGSTQSEATGGTEQNVGGTEQNAGAGGVEQNEATGGTEQNAGAGGSAGQSPPDSTPSRQTVTFELTNVTDAQIALLVSGRICTAFEVWRVGESGRTRLLREVDYSNVEAMCHIYACADDTGEGTYEWVAPGETRTLVWDAREEVVYKKHIECSSSCGYFNGADILTGVAEPVEAGDYEAVFAWYPADVECPQTTSAGFMCIAGAGMGGTGQTCGGRNMVTAPFVLSASGDATVPVDLG
jgi:hypothetical protein